MEGKTDGRRDSRGGDPGRWLQKVGAGEPTPEQAAGQAPADTNSANPAPPKDTTAATPGAYGDTTAASTGAYPSDILRPGGFRPA